MYRFRRLDINVAYACNLACKGCISLSDFDRRGVEPLQDLKIQCETWSKLIDPSIISIFGGEPLMHPHIEKVLNHIREAWPHAQIRFITNGYLLRKYDPELWFKFGQLEMQISIHRQDHEDIITKEIKRIVSRRKDWKTKRTHSDGHRQLELTNENLVIYKSKFGRFVMPYKLENGELTPFNSDPAKAHAICGNPNVPILYKNKLYKCAPITYLPFALKRTNQLNEPWWKKYLEYTPASLYNENELDEFFTVQRQPEQICSMCPSKKFWVQKIDRSQL